MKHCQQIQPGSGGRRYRAVREEGQAALCIQFPMDCARMAMQPRGLQRNSPSLAWPPGNAAGSQTRSTACISIPCLVGLADATHRKFWATSANEKGQTRPRVAAMKLPAKTALLGAKYPLPCSGAHVLGEGSCNGRSWLPCPQSSSGAIAKWLDTIYSGWG